jgi:hypothetical protein
MKRTLVFIGNSNEAVKGYSDRDLSEFAACHSENSSGIAKQVMSEIAHRAATVHSFYERWQKKFTVCVLV